MKLSRYTSLACFLCAILSLSGSTVAQSSDRDNPTRLTTNEITGNLDGSGNEYFYSFLAGPGELTITVDVKSSSGQALLNFELLDKNAATSLICCEFAQADGDGQSGRDVKSVKLAKQQRVVLHTTIGKSGNGTFRIRFAGAIAYEK
ncbi:MAG TPA: hypothetical protein VFC63_11015 [Blastocatellia bacterium]|nr:hypothetical protein [Blastocatellia bacterium]